MTSLRWRGAHLVDLTTRECLEPLETRTVHRRPPAELPPDLPELRTWPEGPRPFVLSTDLLEATVKRLLAS